MSNKETGWPAFPGQKNEAPKPMTAEEFIAAVTKQTKPTEDEKLEYLRDYFAAKAMQGFAASDSHWPTADAVASNAYEWADAMLRTRGNK